MIAQVVTQGSMTTATVAALVSAIAASVTALTAIAAVWFASRQLRHARTLRDEQAQPYVAAFLESDEVSPHFVNLVIRNFGKTAARNVSVAIDPAPQRSPDDHGSTPDDVLYPLSMRTLVPGQEWRTVWDFSPTRRDMKLPNEYVAQIEFDGVPGTSRQVYYFDLDWGLMIGRRWVTRYTMHDAAKSIREMEKHVKRWSESLSGRGLRVYVRDGDKRDEEQRVQRAESLKEHEEITRMLGLGSEESSKASPPDPSATQQSE